MARRVPEIDTQISSTARNERYIVKRIKARKKAYWQLKDLKGGAVRFDVGTKDEAAE